MPKIPNTRLRLLVEEACWSQARLASAVKAVARETGVSLGCDQSVVSRWLSGTRPRPPASAFLLEALARRLGRAITPHDAGLSSAPADTVGDLSWDADPVRKLAALTSAYLTPDRRHLLTTGTYSPTALAVPDPAHLPRSASIAPNATMNGTGRVGRAEIEHLRTMARLFAEAAGIHGGGHAHIALTSYLSHEVARWLRAPMTEAIQRQLFSLAAWLTTLLGTMSADTGADALAQHYYRTAAHLASVADDPTTFGIALRAMSTHAHNLGHHTPSVTHLAERAVDATRHAPVGVRTYAQAQLAVMHAHHDRHAALATLATAERLHNAADSAPDPFTTYTVGALHYQRAETLATLGDRRGAISALTMSLHGRTGTERLAAALTQARLAEVLLTQGHLDEATFHWQSFLDTYPRLRSARAARRLDAMRQFLVPHRHNQTVAVLLAQAAHLRH